MIIEAPVPVGPTPWCPRSLGVALKEPLRAVRDPGARAEATIQILDALRLERNKWRRGCRKLGLCRPGDFNKIVRHCVDKYAIRLRMNCPCCFTAKLNYELKGAVAKVILEQRLLVAE